MRRLSASGLDLAAACVGPFVLPGIEDASPEAAAGQESHRQIAEWVNAPYPPPALPHDPGARAACEWIGEQGFEVGRAEVSHALCPATGEVREIAGPGTDHVYDCPAGWIPGTADLAALTEGSGYDRVAMPAGRLAEAHTAPAPEILLIDWKSPGQRFTLPRPRDARQLLFGAYCAAWMASVNGTDGDPLPPARARIAWGFLSDPLEVVEDVIEPEDWPAILEELRRVAGKVEAAQRRPVDLNVEVRTGPHCTYCPSKMACPATRAAVEALTVRQGVRDAHFEGRIDYMTPETLAMAYEHSRHLRKILDMVDARAKLLAADGLLPGWSLAERNRTTIHGGIAFQVLAAEWGPHVAKVACSVEVSKAALTDAIKAEVERQQPGKSRGAVGPLVKRVVAQIAEAGGVTVTPYRVLVEDDDERAWMAENK